MARQAGTGNAVMPAPLVSVVVPFLNPRPDFFREAIDSVVAQSYRPIELILVNDGSGREAVQLARQLIDSIGLPARYLEHPGGCNRGISATRNVGANAATGEYLAFLDADDAWVLSKLSDQLAVLSRHPQVALVFGQTRYWFTWQGSTDADFVVTRGVEREIVMPPPHFVARFLRGRIIVPSASNTFMRRRAFLGCGGFEEKFRGMYEDQAFLVKLGLGCTVAGVPECWDNYRQHRESMTARAEAQRAERDARRTFLSWVAEVCAERGLEASAVMEAVKKETWLLERPGDSRLVRRLKKGLLQTEERLLPEALRQRLWCR